VWNWLLEPVKGIAFSFTVRQLYAISPSTSAIFIDAPFCCQLQATQRRSQLMVKRRKMGRMNVIIFPTFSHFR
jgi:hypothetical protein